MNEQEVIRYVTECYRRVLKRNPDSGGLKNYTQLIMRGSISRDQLLVILGSSPEWKHRFGSRRRKVGPIEIHRKKDVEPCKELVSIIVLEYNTIEVFKPCIASVLEKTVQPYELIVVDNGSVDGSLEWAKRFDGVHMVIENNQNFGWTKANNIGMKNAKGQYFLLLNSDIVVINRGWLREMVKCAADPSVGTVGAKLLYPNGKIQHIGGGIRATDPYHPYDKSPANIRQAMRNRIVPYNTGACLLIKRSTIEKVGFLDEGFFLGYGDVDYGLRVVMKGLRNVFCANAVLTHYWAYTQRKTGLGITQQMLRRHHAKWNKHLPVLAKKVRLSW